MGTQSSQAWLVCSLALLVMTASFGRALAQDNQPPDAPALPPVDPNSPDAAYLFGFPFCKCKDYRCSTGPYKVERDREETMSNGNYRVCFRFEDRGCHPDNECCNSVYDVLGKIEFQAGASGRWKWVGRGTGWP